MNYEEALKYIHGTMKFGSKLGLKNITYLLELMGDPHKKLKYVHIAGTNGKGSTVAFTSSILIEAGYNVGIYTSPYIQRFTERIKVNNEEIPESELARITEFVKSKVEIMVANGQNHPTEFEIVTSIAFQYYYEKKCDIVVLEVGLGGRFDSTNVIDQPEVAVITTINFDHMKILGDTLPKIAFEKAGIIKEGSQVLLYPQTKEVETVFEEVSRNKNAKLKKISFDSVKINCFGVEGQSFDYDGYKDLKITLLGEHQIHNAVMALNAALVLNKRGFDISEKVIRKGLLKARWAGRLEIVSREPLIMIDGAHNPEGACVLTEALQKYFPEKKKVFIFGVLKDKDYKSVVEIISPIADSFIAVTPNSERALKSEDLAVFLKNYCDNVTESDTIKEAVTSAMNNWSHDSLICAFGSLYYIGEVREMFL